MHAVRAQHHPISWQQWNLRRDIRLIPVRTPQRARQSGFKGAGFGLFAGHRAIPHALAHPVVIVAQLLDGSAPHQIGPAVTHMRHPQLVTSDDGHYDCGCHRLLLGVGCRARLDRQVGLMHRLA